MKNLKKVIILLVTFVLILNSSISSVYAISTENEQSPYYEVTCKASEFLKAFIDNPKLGNPIELYDLSDNVVALFYDIKSGGYIIINVEDYSVPEFSPISPNKYIKNNSKFKYYYNGPCVYMAMDGDDIIDLKTKENLGNLGNLKKIYTDTINDELIYYKNTTPVTSYDLLNTSAATPVTIPGTVPNYSYNPNGICGSTATAMMLRYLDIYFPSDYVPASLETSDGIALINYLVPYLHDPGSYLGELWGGIIDYLRSQNINDYVVWDVAVMGLIINVVSNSHPYVLGLHQHPKYSEHWVTGYGYYNATTGYAIVNDGWGSTYVFIDLSYADYMVWLE